MRCFSLDWRKSFSVGVLGSGSCSNQSPSPEMDPLSEECSLSPGPSLSQLLLSANSPPVCWRIQSSVRPCAGRRARFASTAALMSPSFETKSGSGWVVVNVGAGRRNGVWNSRRRMGDSSDGSLLRTCFWVSVLLNAVGGCWYGDPQLAV